LRAKAGRGDGVTGYEAPQKLSNGDEMVFCKNCKYYKPILAWGRSREMGMDYIQSCIYSKNLSSPDPISGHMRCDKSPEDINKKCDCSWYVKRKSMWEIFKIQRRRFKWMHS